MLHALFEIKSRVRSALDRADVQREELKATQSVVTAIEDEIRERMKRTGKWEAGCSMKVPGLSVSVSQKYNAVYDPEKWAAVMKWATDNDYTHIVQRRLSAAPVRELELAGVALPDGLKVEPYLDLGTRRS